MTTKRIVGLTVVLFGAFLLVATGGGERNIALAQTTITEPEKKDVDTELIYRQQSLKKQFGKLTRMMLVVADELVKTEPESARAIKMAVAQAQGAFIDDDMEKVISYLKKGLASMAGAEQEGVVEELKKVLKTLQSSPLSAEAMNEQVRKWSQFLEDINALTKREQAHQRDAHLAAEGAELAKQFRELGKKLEELIRRQENTLKKTKGLPAGDGTIEELAEARREIRKLIEDSEALARASAKATPGKLLLASETQKDLKARADKLGEKLEKLGKGAGTPARAAESAAKDTALAAGQMDKASDKLAATNSRAAEPHQKQAIADLKEAEKKLTDAIEKMGASSKASDLSTEQKQLAGETSELSKAVKDAEKQAGTDSKSSSGGKSNLDKASGHMSKAADSLGEQNKKAAAGSQQKALEQMRKEAKRLADLERKMEEAARTADLERQKQAQDATAKQTDQTAQNMKKSSDEGQPTPGRKSAAGAAESMKQASGSLGKGDACAACGQQGQAVEQLKQAAEELRRAIDEARAAAQEETLAKIKQILRDALERQKEITKLTDKTYKQRKGDQYERPQVLKLAELSDGEGELAEKINGALARIRAEGTTAVFPMVLDEVHEDLSNVQDRLAKKKAGPLTQSVQKGIAESLEELVDALQKEMRRRKNKGGPPPGGGGGGGRQPPLVPPVAELKMLRSLQKQINKRTLALDAGSRSGEASRAELEIQHKIIAKRESRLVKTTLELNKKLRH
ncbi:MAG: hypothetical protein SVV80_09820 [Planctomycetota bacterium]|nr:hypothetical protein [Planctomycetota bacterium]